MNKIGVIGLGIIGRIWARHYEDAGVLAGAWNRTPRPDFPQWKTSAAEVAKTSEIIQIVVADPPAVEHVVRDILPVLTAGQIVVQSSTIDPECSEICRKMVESTGASYLEAPFTGSKPAAEARESVYYLGGDAEVIAKVEPVLKLVSAVRFHIGTNRQATILKLAMNLNIAVQMAGLAEALTLARSAKISDDVFFNVMARNVGYSGLTRLKEPKLRAGDYSPQFSVKHLHKDIRLADQTSKVSMPALKTVRGILSRAEAVGLAEEDFAALIKLLSFSADT